MSNLTLPLLDESATPPARSLRSSKPDWYIANMDLCDKLASALHLDQSQAAELAQEFVEFNDELLKLIKDMTELRPRAWPLASTSTNKAIKKMVEDGPKEVERLARKMAKELSSSVLNTDNSAFEKLITDTSNNPITTRIVVSQAERAKRNAEATEKLHEYFEDLKELTEKYFDVIKQADKDRWDRIKLGVKLAGALASAYGVGKGVHKAAYILQTIVQELDELAEAQETCLSGSMTKS